MVVPDPAYALPGVLDDLSHLNRLVWRRRALLGCLPPALVGTDRIGVLG
jgi:hypothetical protein